MCLSIPYTSRSGYPTDESGSYFISRKKRAQLPILSSGEIEQLITSMHEGTDQTADPGNQGGAPGSTRHMIQDQYAQLREAVKEGAGKLAFQVEYGSPNQVMLENIQKNLGSFAAFKNHHMIGELVNNLKDDNGNLKQYNQFRKDALRIIGDYRESWLQTEYDTAVRSSRMATVWQSIVRSKNVYPNIKYTASRSAIQREDHLSLVGTILPVDHPFWQIHFPPNGYGCKCGAQPTDEQPVDIPVDINIHPAFAFNPGVQGKIFDLDNHPYADVKSGEYKKVVHEAWGALCAYEKKIFIKTATDSGFLKMKIPVQKLSAPVSLNRASLENTLHYDSTFLSKLNLLQHIDAVMKSSELVESETIVDVQHLNKVHTFHYKTKDDQEISIRVDERKDGKCYLHSLRFPKK